MAIYGAHVVLYSKDAAADRAFFRDVFRLPCIDAGGGWLLFGLPAAELGIHPGDGRFVMTHADRSLSGALLYLMCDDLAGTVQALQARGARCTEVLVADWGRRTSILLPGGGEIGLYEPAHPTALGLSRAGDARPL